MRDFLKQITFPKRLNLLFISIFLFGVATSMNAVIFPTILRLNAVNPTNIGIAFATDVFGGIIMSFILHRLVKNLGIMNALNISAIGYALVTALIFFYQGFLIWLCLAFFMGMCFFAFNITRYAWMNILLTSHRRSVALGIFSMVLASGVAAGPVIVKFSGAQNYISFLISAAITIISLMFLAPMRASDKVRIAAKRIPLIDFFRNNPRCFLARFFLDFQSYLLLTLTVVFGEKIGLSPEKSGLLITACMISGFVDVWVGFALKKKDAYRLIRYGFFGCFLCFTG